MIKWILHIINPLTTIEEAIILLERDVYHVSNDDVGLYHLSTAYVREVNRILGRKKFTFGDRNLAGRSREMVVIFLEHHVRRYTAQRGEAPSALRCCEMHITGGAFGRANPQYTNRLGKK